MKKRFAEEQITGFLRVSAINHRREPLARAIQCRRPCPSGGVNAFEVDHSGPSLPNVIAVGVANPVWSSTHVWVTTSHALIAPVVG